MTHFKSLLIAAPLVTGLIASPAAHADWHGHRGWEHHGWGHYEGHRGGFVGPLVAGTVLGLGIAAIAGGVAPAPVYAAPPPVVYAPPPVYYPAPAYYAAPAYYR
jgi:hypothetical protein